MPNSQDALLKLRTLRSRLEQQVADNCSGQGFLANVPEECIAQISDEVALITQETLTDLERVRDAIALLESDKPGALECVLQILMSAPPAPTGRMLH